MAQRTEDDGVPLEEFDKIPYFAKPMSVDHAIASLSFYVGSEWHCWLPAGNRLVKAQMLPVEAKYFGDKAERPTDHVFPLLNLIAQRALFPEANRYFRGIWNDYQGLATSLAKLRAFFELKDSKYEVRRFAMTEVEYIVFVCRSLFDLLQELIAVLIGRCEFSGQKLKQLPKSYADIVLHANNPRTATEITDKYGLPMAISEWYVKHLGFFLGLRKLRDSIVHGGADAVKILFVTERGFAITKDQRPYCELYQWPVERELPNGLVPLRPVICLIVQKTIDASSEFADVIQSVVHFPPELAPGFRLYSRGHFDQELSEMPEAVSTAGPGDGGWPESGFGPRFPSPRAGVRRRRQCTWPVSTRTPAHAGLAQLSDRSASAARHAGAGGLLGQVVTR